MQVNGSALGGYGTIDNRDSEGGPERTSDVEKPPLGIKLTVYRLVNIGVMFGFGLAKAILNYKGLSTLPTTLEWLSGGLFLVILWAVGLYEGKCSKKWDWLFQFDLAPEIGYLFQRFVGGVLGVLFALQGTLTITSLCSVPFFLLAHFIPHVSLDIWLVAYTWFTLCVHYFWMRTRRLRVGTRVRQFMVCLLQTHGLAAPLSERHEWAGTIGMTLGFFCGIALVCSPLGVAYLSLAATRELHDKLGEVYG